MQTLIQIIYVKPLQGTAKKTGNAYDMRLAQTIAHVPNKDGVVEPLVGELVLPQELKDTKPGYYLVDFRLSVTQQKRIESVCASLMPCDSKGNVTPQQRAA